MTRKSKHGIDDCEECETIWLQLGWNGPLRFNALRDLCRKLIDKDYSPRRLQFHLKPLVARKFVKRARKGPEEVVYSAPDAPTKEYFEKLFPITLGAPSGDGERYINFDELTSLMREFYEVSFLESLELQLKALLKENARSKEQIIIQKKKTEATFDLIIDNLRRCPESDIKELLKTLRSKWFQNKALSLNDFRAS